MIVIHIKHLDMVTIWLYILLGNIVHIKGLLLIETAV